MPRQADRNPVFRGTRLIKKSLYQKAVDYVSKHYFISPRDLKEKGIFRQYVSKLEQDGYIEKYCRGIYISKSFEEEPAFASYVLTCKLIPKGVICLLSALEYHDITTQVPHQIWVCTTLETKVPFLGDIPLLGRMFRSTKEKQLNRNLIAYITPTILENE